MKNQALYYVVFILMLGLTACSNETETLQIENKSAPANSLTTIKLSKSQFDFSDMELGKIEMKSFHEIIIANGMFDVPPAYKASVGSYFGGTVKNVNLIPGESVTKGQVLFTLEHPNFVQMQQDYLEAKGQLLYLESDYQRQKNLAQDNVSSQKNFLKAEADYTVMLIQAESLAKKLLLMNINPNTLTMENIRTSVNVYAPISGYVTQVDIVKGSYLNADQAAVSIIDNKHIHLELNIFEQDLAQVAEGQSIVFNIQEDKSKTYEAVVHLVNKTVDPENRTIRVHGHLIDEKLSTKFNPGMYIEAKIYASKETKAALPEDALVELDGKYYALVLEASSDEGYTFVQKEIKPGISDNNFIEILNAQAFTDSTYFLSKGAFNLINE